MIKLGLADSLGLGNLDARRDWGHSREYVEQMHAMLQLDTPEDFVIATGETHTVREFCEIAFAELGLDYRDYVHTDPRFVRPSEVDLLVGDASKARERLNWSPAIRFTELVKKWSAPITSGSRRPEWFPPGDTDGVRRRTAGSCPMDRRGDLHRTLSSGGRVSCHMSYRGEKHSQSAPPPLEPFWGRIVPFPRGRQARTKS